MRKCIYCKSEMEEDATYCPNCHKRQFKEKTHKKLKKVALVLWLFVFLLIAIIVIGVLNRPSVEEKCKDAKEITLKEVQDAMKENHQNAEATYNNNYYILNGTILHIYSKEVEIKDLDNGYSIFVKFNKDYKDKVLDLKVGDSIKYCGKLEIKSSHYGVSDACIIEE